MTNSTQYLAPGTVTPWGTVEDMTYTAYRMTDGSFVPFTVAHGRRVVEPLVVLR